MPSRGCTLVRCSFFGVRQPSCDTTLSKERLSCSWESKGLELQISQFMHVDELRLRSASTLACETERCAV
eukprot:1628521-Pleurochrysis_carterae.AAC.4